VADETYDVFVSYSRADGRHAADIDSVLRAKGLKSFFDRRILSPGLPWVRALEDAIGASTAVVVLIGPHGLGNTQQYERDLAFFGKPAIQFFPSFLYCCREQGLIARSIFSRSSPGSTSPMSQRCPMRRTNLRTF
jgi:TIR domain